MQLAWLQVQGLQYLCEECEYPFYATGGQCWMAMVPPALLVSCQRALLVAALSDCKHAL
jgi:hypothetical protein